MTKKDFYPIPMTYTHILPYLIQKALVEIKTLSPIPIPPPRNYDANTRCDYHTGSSGHTTDKCLALKFLWYKIFSIVRLSLSLKKIRA